MPPRGWTADTSPRRITPTTTPRPCFSTSPAGAGRRARRDTGARGNIIRPLITVTRAEIEAYLAANALDHVEDSTNAQDEYSRNLIRHAVMPPLRRINPALPPPSRARRGCCGRMRIISPPLCIAFWMRASTGRAWIARRSQRCTRRCRRARCARCGGRASIWRTWTRCLHSRRARAGLCRPPRRKSAARAGQDIF